MSVKMSQSSYLFLVLLLNFSFSNTTKRGPHHPKSELSKTKTKVDHHLTHEEHHIEDDLEKWGLNVNPDEMTEEEKHFYYFKVHDSDNNNALDGLEMLHAALHQDDKSNKLERESYLQNASQELSHIIEVIDDFLNIADINKDGLLEYPEYVKAISGNRDIETGSDLSD